MKSVLLFCLALSLWSCFPNPPEDLVTIHVGCCGFPLKDYCFINASFRGKDIILLSAIDNRVANCCKSLEEGKSYEIRLEPFTEMQVFDQFSEASIGNITRRVWWYWEYPPGLFYNPRSKVYTSPDLRRTCVKWKE